MARDVSTTTTEDILAPDSTMALLMMLVIESDELDDPLYFVQNNVDVVSSAYNGEQTYTAANFTANIPSQEESAVQDTSISISGINRQVVTAIRSITESPDVRMFIIREDTPDTVEVGPWQFKLRDVSYTVDAVTGTLKHEYTLRYNISTITISNQNFPGLYS